MDRQRHGVEDAQCGAGKAEKATQRHRNPLARRHHFISILPMPACIEAFKKPSKAPSAAGLFADRLFRDARLVLGSRPVNATHESLHFL
jgi:hypothetical protein